MTEETSFKDCLGDDTPVSGPSQNRSDGGGARAVGEGEEPIEIVDFSVIGPFEECESEVEEFLRDGMKQFQLRQNETSSRGKCGTPKEMTLLKALSGRGCVPDSFILFFNQQNVAAPIESAFAEDVPVDISTRLVDSVGIVTEAFGKRQFVSMIPQSNRVLSASDSAMMLSILTCAAHKADFFLPCFVPTGDMYRGAYQGLEVSESHVITRFTLAVEPKCPPQCSTLSGLIDLFLLNVGLQSRIVDPPGVIVDAAHVHPVRPANREAWDATVAEENNDPALAKRALAYPFFGCDTDPVEELRIRSCWTGLSEAAVVDTSARTLFDARKNHGSLFLEIVPRSPFEYVPMAAGTVAEAVRKYVRMIQSGADLMTVADDEHIQKLSEAVFEKGKPPCAPSAHSPLSEDLRQVFPPVDLVARFAFTCSQLGSHEDMYRLWLRVAGQLQGIVESSKGNLTDVFDLLAVPTGLPEVRASLFHQKLQMLRCCLEKMYASEQTNSADSASQREKGDGWDDDDDTHNDASDTPSSAAQPTPKGNTGSSGASGEQSTTMSACKVLLGLRLVRSGAAIREPPPWPQDPVTADIIFKQQKELEKLGTQSAAADSRQWLQSETLFADMCAFQYVNGAPTVEVTLADFVQWHSPKDFIQSAPNAPVESYLSERMRPQDSPWQLLWRSATPTLSRMRTFHPDEHVALALKWMQDVTILQVVRVVTLYTISGAVHRFMSHPINDSFPYLQRHLTSAAKELSLLFIPLEDSVNGLVQAAIELETEVERLHAAVNIVNEMEVVLCIAISLRATTCASLVSDDAKEHQRVCEVCDALLAAAVQKLSFPMRGALSDSSCIRRSVEADDLWECLLSPLLRRTENELPVREYSVEAEAERPIKAKPSPQRMYAQQQPNGVFRIALALSELLP